jgi:hypothetical protein
VFDLQLREAVGEGAVEQVGIVARSSGDPDVQIATHRVCQLGSEHDKDGFYRSAQSRLFSDAPGDRPAHRQQELKEGFVVEAITILVAHAQGHDLQGWDHVHSAFSRAKRGEEVGVAIVKDPAARGAFRGFLERT